MSVANFLVNRNVIITLKITTKNYQKLNPTILLVLVQMVMI